MWVKWNLILVRLEIVLIMAQDGARFVLNVARAQKSLWAQLMVHLGNVCQVEACFGPFGDSVSLGAR
jgi:hypothetical protein